MSSSAFVTGALVVPTASSALGLSSFTGRPASFAAPVVRAAKITVPQMLGGNKPNVNKKIPQGFTPYSEILNGRVVMLFFVISAYVCPYHLCHESARYSGLLTPSLTLRCRIAVVLVSRLQDH
jgi:hypothetical protein